MTPGKKIMEWQEKCGIRRCGFCTSYLLIAIADTGKLYCNHCGKEQYVVEPK